MEHTQVRKGAGEAWSIICQVRVTHYKKAPRLRVRRKLAIQAEGRLYLPSRTRVCSLASQVHYQTRIYSALIAAARGTHTRPCSDC